ncbi:MAG: hypothetical protein JSS03_09680 [Proteobacteria bacterium]|nr:hypothetical protein [Pseudomonadota bacterium]
MTTRPPVSLIVLFGACTLIFGTLWLLPSSLVSRDFNPLLGSSAIGAAIFFIVSLARRYGKPLPVLTDNGSFSPGLRRYGGHEIWPWFFGFVVSSNASVPLIRRTDEAWLRTLIVLLPVLPLAMMLRVFIQYTRHADEMQRRIVVEALSFAAALVCLLYFSGGLLQMAKIIDVPADFAMLSVGPMLGLCVVLAKAVIKRRYT